MPEPRSAGTIGRLHRIASAVAGCLGGRDAPWRRRVSPWFTAFLQVITAGRGIPVELNGEPFRIDARYRVFLQPNYEAAVAAFLRPRMRAGQCSIDVGAHIGAYVVQLARWTAPGGRVIAFEPNAGTASVLRRHLRMNGIEDAVRVEQTAVGRTPGRAAFFGEAGSGLSRMGSPNPSTPSAPAADSLVHVLTLDGYCADHALAPDWLLVDVEGYEFDVLAGAQETIARRGAALGIVVEIHPDLWQTAGWSRVEGEALLASLGLRARPLSGQVDPLGEYGTVLLEWSASSGNLTD
jgi:FkbM family methyltransferase